MSNIFSDVKFEGDSVLTEANANSIRRKYTNFIRRKNKQIEIKTKQLNNSKAKMEKATDMNEKERWEKDIKILQNDIDSLRKQVTDANSQMENKIRSINLKNKK